MGSRLESNSSAISKAIQSRTFEDEQGEEYSASNFGGFSDYFRRKKLKLQNLDVELRSQSSDKPQIFRGIVAHVNGYTQPSLNDLHVLIVTHGGGFMQYLDGKTTVTHIIASSLTPKKVVEFKRYRIVKPAWIVDSVKAGRLLPWDNYRVVDEGTGQKVLQFDNGQVISQVNDKVRGYRDQSETSWYTHQLSEPSDSDNILAPADTSAPVAQEPEALDQNWTFEDDDDEAIAYEEEDILEERDEYPRSNSPRLLTETKASKSNPPSLLNPHVPLDMDMEEEHEDSDEQDENKDAEIPLQENDPLETPSKRRAGSLPQSPSSKKARLTAEEHNTILLSDPRLRKTSVLNPNFLEQYYRESRLHHLSTWKADLKSQLQAMTAKQSASQKDKHKRAPGARRYILHVDFDSFFVAVSLKSHPQYVDVPACVAHGTGPGSEIASCNYPARKFGVKNGMWMKRAQEMCKDIKVLPYDFPAYEEASRIFYEEIMATGGLVQSVSIDEALVDVTSFCLPAGGTNGVGIREGSIWREQAKADDIAQKLRDAVKERTGCAISVGIGGNVLLAKVALRKAKPAGQYQVKPEEVLDFLADLQVQSLPGVAYSIGGKLEEIGVKFVKDLRELKKEKLLTTLGPKTGEKLWNYSRGIDPTEVGDQVVRKSVSAEVNWGVRFETQEQAEEFVESLCDELHKRLTKEHVKGRHLTMKIMRRAQDAPLDPPKHLGHGKCDTYNKSVTLGVSTNATRVIAKEALSILRGFGFSPGELRGLGVQMTKLESLKEAKAGPVDSSQRRLQFKTGPTEKAVEKEENRDPIQDDSPKITKYREALRKKEPSLSTFLNGKGDSPSKKPLNTAGTQFILPSQVDPEVLAALPADIRSKLAKYAGKPNESEDDKHIEAISAAATPEDDNDPIESQLDPETLSALPEDLRAEVLAEYDQSRRAKGQSVLPQSPRKVRTLPPSKRGGAARGRPRGSTSLLSRLKAASSHNSTLTQSNFVAGVAGAAPHNRADSPLHGQADDGDSDRGAISEADISPEFLEALPDDIRREVIAEHKANQLKKTAGLEVSRRRGGGGGQGKRSKPSSQSESGLAALILPDGQRVLQLAPRPPRPTFTTKKLSATEDLKDAVRLWHDEFKEEGPYREDVEAIARYLTSVIKDERNMEKAVVVVRWFDWVVNSWIEEMGGNAAESFSSTTNKAEARWMRALNTTKDAVRAAVRERGLGEVDL